MTKFKTHTTPAPNFARHGFAQDDAGSSGKAPLVSVVAPVRNEAGGIVALIQEIREALDLEETEIIVVDDGSTDDTADLLVAERQNTQNLRVLRHRSNAGQSRAIRTGVLAASAPIIATIDGDGQNDPADIGGLVTALRRDNAPPLLSMVAGERVRRCDVAAKRWASKLANGLRSRLLHDGARDTGCGLKVFYREAYLRLPYFDHMHRYLPALMGREGYLIEFMPVNHRPRLHGASKYTNLGRAGVAFRDLLGVLWLNNRARSPIDISEL